ncbi:hypothetical protein HZA56_14155 [Candidatus Poribacteria bacterium]|nr:hypothetical protein [Candidatus Poribacteria bacterium]
MSKPTLDSTLQEVKDYLHEHQAKGVDCPACDRFVKVYQRNLNAGIVINLFGFYAADREASGNYIHVYELMKSGETYFNMEYAKLGWWKMIEKKPHVEGEKKSSGFWRITEKGRNFADELISVPAKAHIYDDRIVGYSEEHTKIREALGKKFDYQVLMGRV